MRFLQHTTAILCASFCASTLGLSAQTAPPRPARPTASLPHRIVQIDPAARARAMAIQSPVVADDRTVTFRYLDPNAKTVTVHFEGVADPLPMTRDAEGMWTAVTGPLDPEFYGYRIEVDGQGIIDPHNPLVRMNLQNPSSIVHVPGVPPAPWDLTDIPHGDVHHHLYTSKLATDEPGLHDRDLYIYTPPGYNPKRKQLYPVLYLLHGYSDSAIGWTDAGQANLIFDGLIAQGKLQPTVIVMPRAYGTMRMLTEGWNVWTAPYTIPIENQTMFTDQLLHEILPFAEANYRVAHDPAHRALAGLSMGGGESISAGLNHPEVFGYVGAFSSAIVSPLEPVNHPAPGDIDADTYRRAFEGIVPDAGTQPALKLFWLSCGTEDGLITVNRTFGAWAKTNLKGNVSINETPGMHTWLVWRNNLITFSQLMFK